MSVLSERLTELRKLKKISLNKLALILDVSDTAIMKWEHGTSEPTASNLKQLAIYFDVTTDYLVGLEDETGAKTYINNSFNNFNNNGNFKI